MNVRYKKFKFLFFSIFTLFFWGFLVIGSETAVAANGCCVITINSKNCYQCNKNVSSTSCKNGPTQMFILGDPNCTNKTCQGKYVCDNATSKGCCSYVAKTGEDPRCVQNQTNDECNKFVKDNSYNLNFWKADDADCVKTRESAGCQANKSIDNCQGKCTSEQECKQQGDSSWKCVAKEAAEKKDQGSKKEETNQDFEEGGLVPCGRNGQSMCTLCHFIVGIKGIIDYGMSIMIVVALTMITIAGIIYIVSAGSTEMMNVAKGLLRNTLVGFTIILGAWLMVSTIMWVMGARGDLGIGITSWNKFSCDTTSSAGTPTTGK